MALLDRPALLMSQDDLHLALNKQVAPKLHKPKPAHGLDETQAAPDSLSANDFSLMPYETAEIQESSQSFEEAVENGEEDSVAAAYLWDEPIKPSDS